MIDFWELTGRLMLMDPATRKHDFYDPTTGMLPLQADGCILLGYAHSTGLAFPIAGFYNALRDYFTLRYTGADQIYSPAISMFALGEVGVLFFNQDARDAFEDVSNYLRTSSVVQDRTDKGSESRFYMVLALLMVDSTTRDSVAGGNFLGLAPTAPADRTVLQSLANDATFVQKANHLCFEEDWTEGSQNTLREQKYGGVPGSPGAVLPFRHAHFRRS
jgi:hypothetical protein